MSDNAEELNIPQLFGTNVQKFRKERGMTQEQLSEKLKISQKHLSIIETGTQFASASLIGKLASVLEVSPAQLFGDYKHEVNYEQAKATANATVDVLRNVLDGKFSALYGQLNEIENLLQTKQNGFPPPGSGLTLPM